MPRKYGAAIHVPAHVTAASMRPGRMPRKYELFLHWTDLHLMLQ